ncbi:MAG: hypothetical protein LBC96_06825 [Lachnospiraceae bacterium]|jgi:hypothetical protein|nr:hypothetical protein [Lachnospiraceae bacterium]
MENLLEELEVYISALNESQPGKYDLTDEFLENLYSVFPFNRFEYVISHLIANHILDLEQYYEIRCSYLERNKYLYIFEITAPRTFGETWAHRHLNELIPELKRPTKKTDPSYSGQYDFWYDGIRIEIKASRAVKRQGGDSLIMKALSTDSLEGFDMNFQQLKPRCCDIFLWVGVWRDAIRYWVLSSEEVKTNQYYSDGQHRGNIGEGQLWITEKNIVDFTYALVHPRDLLIKIIEKGR